MAAHVSLRTTRTLARLLSSVFFRGAEVEGAERIPREGPLIYAVNHPNALVDPLLIHALLPRAPRFLAKHSLWDVPAVRPFLLLAGSIPIYRKQDEDAKVSKNLETFSACYEALAGGAVIGIFPEGVSYTEPSMMPVKTGIARIVLGAEEQHGPLGIRIVPVGLTFDAKHRFRSRVLLTVGEPIGPVGEVPRDKGEFRRLRNALTKEVGEALQDVTLNYGSWKEARLIERAGDLYARTPSELPNRPGLSDLFEMRKQFLEGYGAMRERRPERVADLARSVDAYDRMLRLTAFTDEQVLSSYPRGSVFGYLARTLARLFVYLPLAAAGILLNWIPYRFTARIAGPFEKKPEVPATRKIIGGFFAYPVVWALEALLAGFLMGWRWVPAVFLLAPLTGYIAMRFMEEGESFWTESFNYLRLRSHRKTWDELRRRRGGLSAEITALVRDYLRDGTDSAAGMSRKRGDPSHPPGSFTK
jgi:glycerol-3-phosphate O-acyltransferase/dihydroxyacetone phosphate acyltransferase